MQAGPDVLSAAIIGLKSFDVNGTIPWVSAFVVLDRISALPAINAGGIQQARVSIGYGPGRVVFVRRGRQGDFMGR